MQEQKQVLAFSAPIDHRMSLEEAISEYVRIDARLQELYQEKKRCLEVLLPAANEVRGQSNTTRLDNNDGTKQLKVEFGNDYKCDVFRLSTVREMLGDDVFETLFKVELKAKLKGLKPFLATKSTDEQLETAKEIIKEAVTRIPKSPTVTIEKGREQI